GGRGGGNLERVARVARAATGAPLLAARLRRGPLPREVVAAPRGVRRGRARSRAGGRRAPDNPARLLDGRRGGDLGGRRAVGRARARPRSLDPRSALVGAVAGQAARRPPRLARPLG